MQINLYLNFFYDTLILCQCEAQDWNSFAGRQTETSEISAGCQDCTRGPHTTQLPVQNPLTRQQIQIHQFKYLNKILTQYCCQMYAAHFTNKVTHIPPVNTCFLT